MLMEYLRMAFCFLLLLILGALTFAIALGKVEAATSAGLTPLVTCLATMGGIAVQFVCRSSSKMPSNKDDDKS